MSGQKRYSVILADPPWQYNVYNAESGPVRKGRAGNRGIAERHYQPMTIEDLLALPIGDLAAKDAALFLWTTPPMLRQGLMLADSWGFKYRTVAFSWVKLTRAGKPIAGLGHYTRGNVELCLFSMRGRMVRKAANVPQVIMSQRREHSRKPDEQYPRIMRLFDGPYLELFARQRWPGFDVWGNQTDLFPVQPVMIGEEATA